MPKASPTKSTPARNSKPYRPPYYRPGDHIRGKRVYLADTYWLGHSEWEYLGEIIQRYGGKRVYEPDPTKTDIAILCSANSFKLRLVCHTAYEEREGQEALVKKHAPTVCRGVRKEVEDPRIRLQTLLWLREGFLREVTNCDIIGDTDSYRAGRPSQHSADDILQPLASSSREPSIPTPSPPPHSAAGVGLLPSTSQPVVAPWNDPQSPFYVKPPVFSLVPRSGDREA